MASAYVLVTCGSTRQDAKLQGWSPEAEQDASLELHDLTSLRAEIEGRVPHAVADARDQNITWTDIGSQLGLTTSHARQLHLHHADAPPRITGITDVRGLSRWIISCGPQWPKLYPGWEAG